MSFVGSSLKKVAAVCLCAVVASCAPSATPRATAPNTASLDVVGPRKVIALVPNDRSRDQMQRAARAVGYEEIDTSHLSGLDLSMLTFRMPVGVTGAEAIAALEAAVPGSVVGINHAYRLQQQQQNRAAGPLDYAGPMIRWRATGCRAQTSVGMIDTGIDTTSATLAGAQIQTKAFFEGTAAPATHGTEVATVLAGPNRLRGAKIFGANVFGQRDAQGPVAGADALVRALDWLAEEDVRFVNLALAGPYNKLLDLAVERATERGLILVAAVGNDGPQVDPMYPAGFERVIAVTAIDANARIYRNAVRGAHVDVAAPGVDVLVPSDSGPRLITGTSIATPFVTARLAADPALVSARRVSAVRSRLAATSTELGPLGRDPTFGYGLVRADGACRD